MGVRKLTSYVNNIPSLWKECDLTDKSLVIDGNGLLFCLYSSLDCRYGGQYSDLEQRILSFFEKLRNHGVKPYVVFDGILDESDKKLQTFLKRRTEEVARARRLWVGTSIKTRSDGLVIPLLAKTMFVKCLQEINVPYAIADFEADNEIASLANDLEALVMSSDSDFFIFEIKHGYIPINSYDFDGTNMVTRCYKRSCLAKHFNIPESMLPLLASLVGNDYVPDELLSSLSEVKATTRNKIEAVAKYLANFDSIDSVMKGLDRYPDLSNAVKLSLEEYNIKPTHLFGYFTKGSLESNLVTYNGHRLPEWLIKVLRSQSLHECIAALCHRRVFLAVCVEEMTKTQADKTTMALRSYLYKVLAEFDEGMVGDDPERFASEKDRLKPVSEYGRTGFSTYGVKGKNDLISTSSITIKVQLSEIPTLRKIEASIHVLNTLLCDMGLVSHISVEWQLVVAALRFWLINSSPEIREEHVVALLVYFVEQRGTKRRESMAGVKPQHAFAQWQQVILWVNQVNTLFCGELSYFHPAVLYDGKRVCKLYQHLEQNGIQAILDGVRNKVLYQQLYDASMKDLPPISKVKRSEKPVQKTRKTKELDSFLKGNRFGVLSLSSESDED